MNVFILSCAVVAGCIAADNRSIESVEKALSEMSACSYTVTFTVAMPQLPEDVRYHIDFTYIPVAGDTLLPASYLINWRVVEREENFRGFSSYFFGNHYRFSGEKLQEYHAQADITPFLSLGADRSKRSGVQHTAQFANLLPCEIARDIAALRADTATSVTFCADTVVSGRKVAALTAVTAIAGETVSEKEYLFDSETLFPLAIQIENNPGMIGEQTIEMAFMPPKALNNGASIDENKLRTLFPDEFIRLRQSNFTLENMIGTPLPGFSLPTPTGERYTRTTRERFPQPVALALIDPKQSFALDVVTGLRAAADNMPMPVNLIFAFTSNNADEIEALTGRLRTGEAIVQSAHSLARDFGAATLPVVLLVNTVGTVEDVIVGYNNNLVTDVIQKMTLKCK